MIRTITATGIGLMCALTAMAQDTPNGGFEGAWEECTPWTSSNNTNKQGTQPASWKISHVAGIGGLGATEVGSQVTGNGSDKAVRVNNNANPIKSSEIVPGFLTLGTPWSTAKGITTVTNKDGGTFGGISFGNRPDAIQFSYRRGHGSSNPSEPFTVVAYLWKGQTSQANVPGDIGMFSTKTCTMVDRDRNILGMATSQGGAVTPSEDFQLVASLNVKTTGDTDQWTLMTLPLEYAADAVPTKANVIISAGDYFSDSNIGNGNWLEVDDVTFIYYSRFSVLEVNGTEVPLQDGVYDYDLAIPYSQYDPYQLGVELMGHDRNLRISANDYDPQTNTQNITLTAPGKDVDGQTSHTYRLHFADEPAVEAQKRTIDGLLDITMNGSEIAKGQKATVVLTEVSEGVVDFTLPDFSLEGLGTLGDISVPGVTVSGDQYSGSLDNMSLLGGAIHAKVTISGTITEAGEADLDINVVWMNGDNPDEWIPITVRFYTPKPETRTIQGFLDITMNGNDIATKQAATIQLTTTGEGTVDFLLPDLTLEGLGTLGDISVSGVTVNGDQYSGEMDDLSLLGGAIHAKVTLAGTITEAGVANLEIAVLWKNGDNPDEWIPITVRFYTETSGIDDLTADQNGQDADAPVVYYNLQGQRVTAPAVGTIVVRVQSGRAVKVRI